MPVVVDNRPGDGATAAPAFVAAAPADGRTLLINTSAHAYSAALSEGLAYDPIADFVAIAPVTSQPYVLVTSGGSEIGSLADLVRVAEARRLAFASAGTGTATHVAIAQLNLDLGICADHVPARAADGIAATIARVAAGELDYAMSPIPIAQPHLGAGTLTALGVSAAQRSPLLPELPTLQEAGADGFDFPIWYGIWGPAATPASRVEQLAGAIADALQAPQLMRWLGEHGAEPMRMTPPQFAQFVVAERDRATSITQTAAASSRPRRRWVTPP